MCYIASSNMILFTFVIPIGCTLLSNIVLFCFVIVRIEILPDVNSAGGKNRNTFLIYIKLTCLTGVTWIFGFIYQWTLIKELSYIFIICNASQGLFIFLSFGFNARVRNMCRSRYKNTKALNKSSTISALSTKKTQIVVNTSYVQPDPSNVDKHVRKAWRYRRAINRMADITMVKRKREKVTNNNLQNTTENKRSRNRNRIKNRVNSGAPDGLPYFVPLVAPAELLFLQTW